MLPRLRYSNRSVLLKSALLLVLILGRLLLQGVLYHTGFQALTADDFGRTLMAARWAHQPYLRWYGPWLPFHMYTVGMALWLEWDLLFTPRLISILFGIVSIILMYLLTWHLFESRLVALVSATLLSINPAHTWLSSTGLTELPNLTLIIAALLSYVLYIKHGRPYTLALCALALGLANGFRLESWLFSAIFSIYIIERVVRSVATSRPPGVQYVRDIIILTVVWVVPGFWMLGNYLESGHALYFVSDVTTYKDTLFNAGRSYAHYLHTLRHIDPYATVLAASGLFYCMVRYQHTRAIEFFCVMAILPFALFCILHQGRIEWPPHVLRYLTTFLCITYPAVAVLIVHGVQRVVAWPVVRGVVLVLLVGIMVTTQVIATLHIPNDPSIDGLAVGQRIQALRQEQPELAQRPVLIEVLYWEYMAIQVGASDITTILYDRSADIPPTNSPSIFLSDVEVLQTCLHTHDIGLIIVKSEVFVQVIEEDLDLTPAETINGYHFYHVPANRMGESAAVTPPSRCFYRFE